MSENDPQSVVSDRTVGYTAEQQADQRDPDLLNAISLVLVSPGAWQVRDSRRTPGREGNLLGFVQERQGNFEVMQLADEFRWSIFPTMELAVDHIANTNAAVIAARHLGDLGWVLSASETTRSLALAFSPELTRQETSAPPSHSPQLVA